ncbi:hypothetical protein GCM10007897_05970 [Sphingobium jiangsuense]|nr:hypothetical protein GCM10007897_05970 [Sphingobium jiangsuense]
MAAPVVKRQSVADAGAAVSFPAWAVAEIPDAGRHPMARPPARRRGLSSCKGWKCMAKPPIAARKLEMACPPVRRQPEIRS